MRRFAFHKILNLTILTFTVLSISAQEPIDNLSREIDKLIRYETELKVNDHQGFVIGIVDADTCFFRSLGRDADQLNEQSIFEVGSVSKVFLSSLVNVLASKKMMSLSDKVNESVMDIHANEELDNITLEDLLTHQSGFPKRPSFFGVKEKYINNPYAAYTQADLMDFYKSYSPNFKNKYRYSHTNYALAEWMIERSTDMTLNDAMNEHLIEPLGLINTFIHRDSVDIAHGYNRADIRVNPWTYQSFAGSEGVKSTAEDLCTFTRLFFERSEHPFSDVLRESLSPIVQTNYDKNIYMGLGWHIVKQRKNYNIIMHSGQTSGHHTILMMIPETDTAVIILSTNAGGTQNLAYELLRMINYNWKRKSI